MMPLNIYLQIISMLMAVIAVVVPVGITVVGYVYVKQLTTKIESLTAEVNLLWNEIEDMKESSGSLKKTNQIP